MMSSVFGMGRWSTNSISCKASQNMCKVHTSSHEVTNAPYVRANDENTTTTVTVALHTDITCISC